MISLPKVVVEEDVVGSYRICFGSIGFVLSYQPICGRYEPILFLC